ncbi:MAG: DUF975 family protein [Muribaculum sp.]|nr:DUF975 family protein [Muribaculaceae bacterium]MCM1081154.1 DUF975 family protein [Muribaculum sp.]
MGRADLENKWDRAVVFAFLYLAITAAASVIPYIGNLLALLLLPMSYSFEVAFLGNMRQLDEPFKIAKLFDGFYDFSRVFATLLLKAVYTFLWFLLLIVPGIIKGISYSMTSFILKDRPDLGYNAAIELSMAMMYGHKMKYFLLMLSFIGWFILCIITLGIGFLWLAPYVCATKAHFYEVVKAEYEAAQAV